MTQNHTTVRKVYYESDFVTDIILPAEVGDSDFIAEFYTQNSRIVRFYKCDGKLSPNLKSVRPGVYLAVFRKHNLSPGRLEAKIKYILPNESSFDGKFSAVTLYRPSIELSRSTGDIPALPEINLITSLDDIPAVAIFNLAGYTDKEIEICFGDDILYSTQVAAEYESGKINNFSEDNTLVYPPVVNLNGLADFSRFYYRSGKIIVIPTLENFSATDMTEAFAYCSSLRGISQLDTRNVENMDSVCYSCTSLASVPQWNTSNVKNMAWAFGACTSLLEFPSLDVSNVINASNMLNGCKKLVLVAELNTENSTSLNGMFSGCIKLERIESLDFSSAGNITNIFYDCSSLKYLVIKNLGASKLSFYNLSEASNWGTGGDENRKSLVDSLLLYSCNRIGMEIATIRLSPSSKSLLTEDELQAIQAKGYEIVAY